MKSVRTIALVSDVHSGTSYGLAPPGFYNDEGNLLKLNRGQESLLDFWYEYIDITHREGVDTVLYLGDLCHGQNPKGRGIQMMTTDMDIQQMMVLELLKPMARGRKNYFVHGSGYHAHPSPGVSVERNVCNELGKLEGTVSEWWGPFAFREFEPSKRVWLIQHGVSQAYIYREMIMGRENLHANAAAALGKTPFIDVVVKGHWHSYVCIEENGQFMVQCPCWCMFIPWRGTLMMIPRFQPDIGGVIIKIMEDERIVVKPYVFKPTPKVVGDLEVA